MDALGHGKIILFGEHAVVHGYPALALTLPIGCRAHARVSDHDSLALSPLGTRVTLGQPTSGEHEAKLQQALATALQDAPADRPKLAIEAELQVPAGAGLGASAAISVAVARANDQALGRQRNNEQLIDASWRWERVYHGNPSGVDSTMAVLGGLLLYRRGQTPEPIAIDKPPPLVVAYSGSAPSTREMVESVDRQYKQGPQKVRQIFEAIESIVHNGKSALVRGDWAHLGQLMTMNQKLLSSLMLSTSTLEEMCSAALAAGATGAKLTGGGGGGCMIALGEDADSAQRIATTLRRFDPKAFVLETSS